MGDCLFCKIIKKEIPAEIVYENDNVLAFKDINPQAPTHILIIPKIHVPTLNELEESHKEMMGELLLTSSKIAKQEGIADDGYRTGFNCGEAAGQTVWHIHLHLLGGRSFNWPPG
ncbi:MAG: histidine triad nucleotide-binding protein [Candidatus Marinimicrobia bacterium]|jgi:histidine triad (HIT) family protein|nr:histidine triad nucleotide-binding protein [Candidatus Neomarinimicrobiota bacterium]MBT3936126.1 histidine triad nucleotide-binding protein [Candidatus Neomarinimicrobiota bacterium]MBT3961097.1 histidine triad nucleotide-binding protein [Candidatus Neomarinimicrobiota bacterium]MBT4383023.1 histidine triad nucleotide-binding protein [Candidatus Neomarinimicrobiota bacterium]MBT4636481.1 histidine triad nucleotide-binding protein [Candidatus Neomarinimicrobiota bacterium]